MKWKELYICLASACFVACDPHCGYEACPKIDPKMLTVHLVPHTHDDVGWVKTVDEYFYGEGNYTHTLNVIEIIESVVKELQLHPRRKFIWVETAYFWKWWTLQKDETLRNVVKKLVAEGQLEFTGGAWSMNDEAVTHYQSTIDQFTWGFRRLSDIFGDCGRPHVGWQIDPFGHSRETASLMAQMGFDGLFFGRLDEDDKRNRMRTKSMEMIWRGSKNLGPDSDLFTGVLFNLYSPPRGFCFDLYCADYIDDNPNGNFREKVSAFIQLAKEQAENYKTNNILWTMGMDFNYMVASRWYSNMEILMKHVNSISNETGIVAVYSTPSCYLQELYKTENFWPTKEDDFFPYASEPHSYWTGFYTSRPNLKRFERTGNNLLQVCKQLHVLAENAETDDLNSLREAMGVLQHHDAITGTEQQHVADDYAAILDMAVRKCDKTVSKFLNKLTQKDNSESLVRFERCPLLNISQCPITEKSPSFVVTIYNPLAREVRKFIRLPVTNVEHTVTDLSSGQEVEIQYVPIMREVQSIPVRRGKAVKELIFEATGLPPLGFKSFHVKKTLKSAEEIKVESSEVHEISNEFVKVSFDKETNLLKSVTVDSMDTPLKQELLYYQSAKTGNQSWEVPLRASGAYIFRPEHNVPLKITTQAVRNEYHKGDLVQEVHQTFSSWASQVIRLYRGQKHVEIEWLVGPIPTTKRDGSGKEVISKFSSDLQTYGQFKTDSNSREYLTRTRNIRETWIANIKEPVAGNYYPITSAISMNDGEKVIAILTDRAQGGGSIEDGSLELMLHRRLVRDDDYGVEEALNERQKGVGMVARGRHILLVAPILTNVTSRQRDLVQREMVLEPTLYFTPTDLSAEIWKEKYLVKFSGMKSALPTNVNLLTLEPWKGDTILLRIEHALEKDDDPILSEPVIFSLRDLFKTEIESVTEMMLGANQKLEDSKRFMSTRRDSQSKAPDRNHVGATNNFAVILYPMQIRTFIVRCHTMS